MPSMPINKPESTPSIERLSLGVASARGGAEPNNWPTLVACSAPSED